MNEDVKIYSLFPTPILEVDIGREFTKEELDFVEESRFNFYKNEGNTTSLNRYILENPIMENVKKFAEKSIKEYINKINNPINNITPYITQSWLNYTSPGEYHHRHSHPNSFISGVLYFNASGENDKIIFFNPRYDYILDFEIKEFNPYNSPSWWLPTNTGKMFIFPSKIQHEVSYTTSNETRISLAFNVFLKGDIGKEDLLTALKL